MCPGFDAGARRPTPRLACLADRYPTLTITAAWREVAALRADGVHVEPFSVWPVEPAKRMTGEEPSRTTYLAGSGAAATLGAHAALLAGSPARYVSAFLLALRAGPPGWRAVGRKLASFGWAVLLVWQIRARGLTHLHCHETGTSCTVAMLAAALGGITFSFAVHGPGVFYEVRGRQLGEKLRRALFVRCISQFTRSQCLLQLAPERWDRLHVIHCGVEPDAYSLRVHQGRGSHLLFVGHLKARKGLPFLIDALAALHAERPDVRLTIVGDGPERPTVEARARAAGIADRVRFTGYQTSAEVAGWLATADVLVHPSLAEGVPVVLMEAMAAGIPVVATNIAGTSELVEDGVNGFLVPPGVSAALVDRTRRLLDDPDLRTRQGRAGRDTVLRAFDVRRETARLRTLFEGVMLPSGIGADIADGGRGSPVPEGSRVTAKVSPPGATVERGVA